MLFYERTKKYEYKLNETEDMIVSYILRNKPEIAKISIQALSDKFFTVPNTIIRLSKKLGYDGFSQLKNNLKQELSDVDYISYENERFGHSLNIKKTLTLMDYELINKIVLLISKSKQSIFFGAGDNINILNTAIKELSLHDSTIHLCTHRHDLLYSLEQFSADSLLFLVSLSGTTSEILEFAKIAKKSGATVIALTHFLQNPLQEIADFNLYCYSPLLSINGYNVSDKTPLLLVLRALTESFWKTQNLY